MMLVTHLLAGAVIGRKSPNGRTAFLLGLGSHALADGIGHNDKAVKPPAQGLIALGVGMALGCRTGFFSTTTLGGFGGALPDGEVAIAILAKEKRTWPLVYPSHIARNGRSGHPYRLPGPAVPIWIEFLVCGIAFGYLWRRQ